MKMILLAIISILGAITWGIFLITIFILEISQMELRDFAMYGLMILPIITTITYIILSKFGKKNVTELEKMEYENQLLKKKIEQKELKTILEKTNKLTSSLLGVGCNKSASIRH